MVASGTQEAARFARAVHDHYADKPVNPLLEKYLREICAMHKEGNTPGVIARKLSLTKHIVKAVIRADSQYTV